MNDFSMYCTIGLRHVLALNAYDHLLFLVLLLAPYVGQEWKKMLLLVSFFTLGHTLSLLVTAFKPLPCSENYIELGILATIFCTAWFNMVMLLKTSKRNSIVAIATITFVFGCIHGLGFSSSFHALLPGSSVEKMIPLGAFALGIEAAQLVVLILVLLMQFVLHTLFRFNKRDFILMTSCFALGVLMPLFLQNPIWKK